MNLSAHALKKMNTLLIRKVITTFLWSLLRPPRYIKYFSRNLRNSTTYVQVKNLNWNKNVNTGPKVIFFDRQLPISFVMYWDRQLISRIFREKCKSVLHMRKIFFHVKYKLESSFTNLYFTFSLIPFFKRIVISITEKLDSIFILDSSKRRHYIPTEMSFNLS